MKRNFFIVIAILVSLVFVSTSCEKTENVAEPKVADVTPDGIMEDNIVAGDLPQEVLNLANNGSQLKAATWNWIVQTTFTNTSGAEKRLGTVSSYNYSNNNEFFLYARIDDGSNYTAYVLGYDSYGNIVNAKLLPNPNGDTKTYYKNYFKSDFSSSCVSLALWCNGYVYDGYAAIAIR